MDAREQMMGTADDLVAGAWAASTESGAMFRAPVEVADRLEGFARSFLLAAIRIAGSGGEPQAWCAHYREAVAAGVTAGHEDAWPPQTDHGPVTVEATAIAVGLHLTRPWIWDELSSDVREQLLEHGGPDARVEVVDRGGHLDQGLLADVTLADRLVQYFPAALRETYAAVMPQHRLHREIITTVAVNRYVNSSGVTGYHRMSDETGASA